MSELDNQISRLAKLTADYRIADGIGQTPENVRAWLDQFPKEHQLTLVRCLTDCLERTYFSQEKFFEFLDMLSTHEKFCGSDAAEFWITCNLLEIQGAGNSQREMVAALKARIKKNTGVKCVGGGKVYVYLDDAIFSGGRARSDLANWVEKSAPAEAELRIVTVGLYGYGKYSVEKGVREAIRNSKKNISIKFWRAVEFENNPHAPELSDVLWPVEIPQNVDAKKYYDSLPKPEKVRFRNAQNTKPTKVFPDPSACTFLEHHLLLAGVEVRKMCPQLTQFQRPLGNILFSSFGFGALFVTFRNCPNNVPISLWAGDPWVPLFPRKTNSDSAFERFVESL